VPFVAQMLQNPIGENAADPDAKAKTQYGQRTFFIDSKLLLGFKNLAQRAD
jgi:hypothetical protein